MLRRAARGYKRAMRDSVVAQCAHVAAARVARAEKMKDKDADSAPCVMCKTSLALRFMRR